MYCRHLVDPSESVLYIIEVSVIYSECPLSEIPLNCALYMSIKNEYRIKSTPVFELPWVGLNPFHNLLCAIYTDTLLTESAQLAGMNHSYIYIYLESKTSESNVKERGGIIRRQTQHQLLFFFFVFFDLHKLERNTNWGVNIQLFT